IAMKWSPVCLMAVAMLIGLCDAQYVRGQNSLPTWPSQLLPQEPAQLLPQTPVQPLLQKPTQPLPQRTTQPLPQWPAQPLPQRSTQPLPQRPTQPLPQRTTQPLPQWPAQPLPQRPTQPLPQRPTQPLPLWPTQPLPQRTTQPLPQWPAQPLPQRPTQRLPQRPTQPLPLWPAQPILPWPTQRLPQRPTQPLPLWPAQPILPWPTQPLPQKPAQPLPLWPAQPLPQWTTQPLPQRTTQPLPQWPSQPLPQRPTQPIPQRPTQPLPQRPTQPLPPWPRPTQPLPQWPTQPLPQWPTCDVEGNDKVQCGLPDITGAKCEAINCCFDGRMCFYGKAVTVQCTRDGQFVVVVARDATLPNLELDSISLLGGNEAHCTPVGITSAFAIYQFKVTECGTVVTEEPGTIFYENRMSSSYIVEMGPLGTITRNSQFNLIFQCRYKGTVIEALVIEVKQVPPPILLPAPGPLRVELRLANGICLTKGCKEEEAAYTSYYTEADYPVTKFLRDPVYAEVRILERTDPNVVLTLGRCWATTNPDPLSLPQWNLIISGCPYKDDRYLTMPIPVEASSGLSFPTHYRRFVLKMFTFVDSTSIKAPPHHHTSSSMLHGGNPTCGDHPFTYSVSQDTAVETKNLTFELLNLNF
uniref:Zona pellucida sperm-binding protein 4 n=1 Tax=Oncorhynchus tshawytscha TaxID=74940 RepID=A0A8C8J592_ONCTS